MKIIYKYIICFFLLFTCISCNINTSSTEIIEEPIQSLIDDTILQNNEIVKIKTDFLSFFDKDKKYTYNDIKIDEFYGKYGESYIVYITGMEYDNYIWNEHMKYIEYNTTNYLYRDILYLNSNRIYVYYKGGFFTLEYAYENEYISFDTYEKIYYYKFDQREQIWNEITNTLYDQYAIDEEILRKYNAHVAQRNGGIFNQYKYNYIEKLYGKENESYAFSGRIQLCDNETNIIKYSYITEPLIYNNNKIYSVEEALNLNIITSYLVDIIEYKVMLEVNNGFVTDEILNNIKYDFYENAGINYEYYKLQNIHFGKITSYGLYNDYFVFQIDEKTLDFLGNYEFIYIDGIKFELNPLSYNIYVYDFFNKRILTLKEAYDYQLLDKQDLAKIRFFNYCF